MKIIIYYIYVFNVYSKNITPSNPSYNVKISKFLKEKIHLISNFHFTENGKCSYYHDKFNNRITASGEVFLNNKWTCAHKFLPLPSIILVVFIYKKKKHGIKILINDRGPYVNGRILDVSKYVAKTMNFIHKGTIDVTIFFLPLDTINLIKTGVYIPINKIFNIYEINEILKKNKIKYRYIIKYYK